MSQLPENIQARWTGEYIDKTDADGTVLERRPAESLPGIPARDLYADEYDALTDEQREAVQRSGLYAVADGDTQVPGAASPAGRSRRAVVVGPALSTAMRPEATVPDAETITVVSPAAQDDNGGTD